MKKAIGADNHPMQNATIPDKITFRMLQNRTKEAEGVKPQTLNSTRVTHYATPYRESARENALPDGNKYLRLKFARKGITSLTGPSKIKGHLFFG